jgi:O-antigen/teichoic acid export membrane protein
VNARYWNPLRTVPRGQSRLLATVAVVLLVGGVAYWQHQTEGLFAASAALLTCMLGVLAVRLIAVLVPNRLDNSPWILLNMLLRMAIPLGICLVALLNSSQFLQFGFAYYLVVFYQLTLVIDVSWSIARLKQPLAS